MWSLGFDVSLEFGAWDLGFVPRRPDQDFSCVQRAGVLSKPGQVQPVFDPRKSREHGGVAESSNPEPSELQLEKPLPRD